MSLGQACSLYSDPWIAIPGLKEVYVCRNGTRPGDTLAGLSFCVHFCDCLKAIRGEL